MVAITMLMCWGTTETLLLMADCMSYRHGVLVNKGIKVNEYSIVFINTLMSYRLSESELLNCYD